MAILIAGIAGLAVFGRREHECVRGVMIAFGIVQVPMCYNSNRKFTRVLGAFIVGVAAAEVVGVAIVAFAPPLALLVSFSGPEDVKVAGNAAI